MKAYITDLGAYTAGKLIGEWVDLEDFSDAEDLEDYIEEHILQPGHEEWFVTDYEGINLGEYPGSEALIAVQEAIDEYGDENIVEAYIDSIGLNYVDIDNIVEGIQEVDAGVWDSPEDWAENFLEDTGHFKDMPDNVKYYFDFASYARDAEYGGEMTFHRLPDGMVWAQWNR